MFTNEIISDCEKASLDDLIELEQEYDFVFPDDLKFFILSIMAEKGVYSFWI